MKKFIFTACFSLLFSIYAFAQTPTPTQPIPDDGEVVKIRTDLIQLDIVVTDKNGKQITDLKSEDFEILENDEKQKITNFSYVTIAPNSANLAASKTQTKTNDNLIPPVPTKLTPEQVKRTIALVVDDLGLSFQSMVYVRMALKKFVDEQMQPHDLVAIIRTAGGIGATQQFTSDKQQLYAAIEKVRFYAMGRAGAGSFDIEGQTASGNQGQRDSFTRGTIGAVNYIISGMRELPGRKAVALFSDGMPLSTTDEEGGIDDTGQILDSIRLLAELANRASVVINTIDARGLTINKNSRVSLMEASSLLQAMGGDMVGGYNTQDGLLSIAEQTGGYAFINNNDIKGSIQTILDNQNGYYLIGYQPDDSTFDPNTRRFNKLKVRIKRPGAKVNYRSGFFGIVDEEILSANNLTPPQQVLNALISPFGASSINLRLNSLFSNDAINGSFIRSFLHVQAKDLKFTDEPNGDKKAIFDIVAYTFGDNGVSIDKINQTYTLIIKQEQYQQILDKGFVYRINLPIKKPGAYQLRIALRDTQGEKIGAANHFVRVPDLKKGFLTLSGIILQSLTREQVQKIAKEQSLLVEKKKPDEIDPESDTALRRFQIGSFLQYGYTIYNAKLNANGQPQLETQLRIFQNGKLFFEGKSSPLELKGQTDFERINYNGAMALPADMGSGEYVLQIVVKDKLVEDKRQIAMQWIDFEIIK